MGKTKFKLYLVGLVVNEIFYFYKTKFLKKNNNFFIKGRKMKKIKVI